MKNCRSAAQRINWFVTDIWQLVIRHADTLICLQWYVLVPALRLSVYTLLGNNKIKFGQKFFASPKIWTPVHLCCILFVKVDAWGCFNDHKHALIYLHNIFSYVYWFYLIFLQKVTRGLRCDCSQWLDLVALSTG